MITASFLWIIFAENDKPTPSGPAAVLTGIASILWPLIALGVIWRLWPVLKAVVESRSFTVEVLGVKLSVEEATKKLQSQIDDLQNEFLKLRASTGSGTRLTEIAAPPELPDIRILWVDDHPENNVWEAAKLRKDGFLIDQVNSTDEALGELRGVQYQVIISDMGRHEGEMEKPDAGLLLLNSIRQQGIAVPLIFYCSSAAVSRYWKKAKAAGALAITSSQLELFEAIQQVRKSAI